MDQKEAMQAAVEIVRAQASARPMTEDEITSMVRNVAAGIMKMVGPLVVVEETTVFGDPKKAIKESSVTCIECGKTFKILTKKHLATHGLTPEEYRAKYGYRKGQALCSKSLVRERRKKMKDMALWLRRKKPTVEAQQ